jgi:type VI secretion system protein ImpA
MSQHVENLRRGAATDAQKKEQLAEALKDGKIEGEKFEKAVTASSVTHCMTVLDNLHDSEQELEQLERILDQKYGNDAPTLRSIREVVGECRSLMTAIVKKKGGTAPQAGAVPESASVEAPMPTATHRIVESSGIVPMDRADALRRLAAVADFFRRTEPHSPVAYLVQRAARWGEMPLEEWLKEVIKSEDVLGNVREVLGLSQASPSGNQNS